MPAISRILLFVILAIAVAACAPSAPGQARAPEQGSAPVQGQPVAPKVLNLVGREGTIGDFPGVVGRDGGAGGFVHDYLVMQDARDAWVGRLAEQISVDNGSWRINPDGTMDTVWKLHPNVKWHDGVPFTADDLLFTYTAFKDPELPSRYGEVLKLMRSAEVLDPLTFVVHWTGPYSAANQAPALNPIPRHLLEDLYLNDKANFGDTTRFNRDFVGLGAYRMVKWEPGSYIQFERFDDYYQGRPPLDSVVLRFVTDSPTIVANLLAGSVDAVYDKGSVDVEAAVELQQRWAGTGNQVKFAPTARAISVEIQFRKEYARPQYGLTERDTRYALMHAIDRPALVEAVTHGLSPIADSWVAPGSEWAPAVEGATPRFPYDTNRAQQLLAGVGWTRGPDGVLIHSATGERFELDLWNRFALLKDQAIVADAWKAVGVQVNIKQLPKARDRELEAKISGGQMLDQTLTDYTYNGRVGTLNIATAANRWTGRNLGGYSNPKVDELLARLNVTIDSREAANIHRDLVQEAFTDLALIPLYFQVVPIIMRSGVTGPVGGTDVSWNFYQWERT